MSGAATRGAAPTSATGSELRFAPQPGTTLVQEWTSAGRRELERLEVRTDDVTSEPSNLSLVITGSKRLVVEDRYEAVRDGRAQTFTRRYETLAAKRKLETTTAEGTETTFGTDSCDIQGRSVRFRWDGSRYERSWFDPDERSGRASDAVEASSTRGVASLAAAEELDGLDANGDLAGFLPPRALGADEVWTIDFEAVRSILRPGGRVQCETDPPASRGERELADRVWTSLTGEVTGRVASVQGARATIALEGTYRGAGAVDASVLGASRGLTAQRVETEMRLAGELVWDLEHHHAHALSLSTSGTVVHVDDILVREEGRARAFERALHFREESELSATFERR